VAQRHDRRAALLARVFQSEETVGGSGYLARWSTPGADGGAGVAISWIVLIGVEAGAAGERQASENCKGVQDGAEQPLPNAAPKPALHGTAQDVGFELGCNRVRICRDKLDGRVA
jgi:hypothetical protein